MYDIDCGLLILAMNYYKNVGYKPIRAPMLVDEDVLKLTIPEGRVGLKHKDKFYVGSAEQSLYQLIKDGSKPCGDYMMITPCQRDEEILDENHLSIFLKVELISTTKSPWTLMGDVVDFWYEQRIPCEIEETKTGFDLTINGLEVGSFGQRCYEDVCVTYGTGLALPRVSQAIARKLKFSKL